MSEGNEGWDIQPSRPALVLGGGGGLGAVQAAYLQAARELGFRPAIVVGTSVGALNGAWVAMHPDDPGGLLAVWRGLHRRKVLRLNPMRLAGQIARRNGGICTNELVRQLIAEHVGESDFETTELPLAVIATNLTRGTKHAFREGRLAPAILASTAIPGVFHPLRLNGELFVDGSVTASVDLATAVEMGATEILAIALRPANGGIAQPRTPLGVMARSLAILSNASTDAMEALTARQMPVRVLHPDLSRHSPWRIAFDDDELGACLREARTVLGGVIDRGGHVVPGRAQEADALAGESTEQVTRAAVSRLRWQRARI